MTIMKFIFNLNRGWPALQWGDVGTAGAEKYTLEEMQRAERKVHYRPIITTMHVCP